MKDPAKFNLPVYPIVIYILPPPAGVVAETRYESEVMGLKALQEYRVINLWEMDASVVFETPLPPLLPFVPIMRGGEYGQGKQEGLQEGLREGQQVGLQDAIMEALKTKFNAVPEQTAAQVRQIRDLNRLRELLHQAVVAMSLDEFLEELNRSNDSA